MPTVELEPEEIELLIKTLFEKRSELDVVLKNPDGLEAETIRDIQMEHRNINNVLRELQFYVVFKDK